jgi:hypothetical protein
MGTEEGWRAHEVAGRDREGWTLTQARMYERRREYHSINHRRYPVMQSSCPFQSVGFPLVFHNGESLL